MAWEWAGPASGVLVGLGGIGGGIVGLNIGRRRDERRDRMRFEHEAKASHGQWHRDRRADAYVELLDLAEELGQWVGSVFPILDTVPPRPVPELPPAARQARVWARVAAFASPAVCELVKSWRDTVGEAIAAAEAVARDDDEARRRLHVARESEREARHRLSEAVSLDLHAVE